ncbi:MAG TPA: response regulator transcription factor [Chitinophagaceae bacterium]|nr:response regulator transcription factor [Chitinophagaceae bacterium]
MFATQLEKTGSILIVDDNMNFVDRIIMLLEDIKEHIHVMVASDFDEAKRVLIHEKPEIALLDINLPGKNGIDLLRYIREKNEKCEVIMITNHADEYYRQQCIDLGAKHFLDKSNDFAQVPTLVNHYLKLNSGK